MTVTFSDLENREEKIAVIGLGYVGLPLAYYLSSNFSVIGFEINEKRVEELKNNLDRTGELSKKQLEKGSIEYATNPEKLKEAKIFIITAPTPVDSHNIPDLTPVKKAAETVGKHMPRGAIVVFESTVYPGATEEVCVPVLEEKSGLKSGLDFKVGYSPERVNPGDTEHDLTKIVKVVGGQDEETTQTLGKIYDSIITAGVHLVSDIKTAEAAKVIENIQRDLNIALVNELALIFNRLGINTLEVINAAATKWNFHRYEPGLVGGHCIGVDPYYLTYKAGAVGYNPEVILAGRRINDRMGKYVGEQTVKKLIEASKSVKGTRVLIMGLTFKENIHDIRNTKVVDIYRELEEFGVEPFIYDPWADPEEVKEEYGLQLVEKIDDKSPYDGIVLAVKHRQFLEMNLEDFRSLVNKNPVFIDVKSLFTREEVEKQGFKYWRL